MENKDINKSLKNIENMCKALLRENQEQAVIPKIPLDKLLATLEVYEMNSGILCISEDCIFNNNTYCGIKTVYLEKGKCPNYSPNLKSEDIYHPEPILQKK